jgi:hypothetical protein
MDGRLTGCARCGAPLTGGRFCTNCGAPVDTGSVPAPRGAASGSPGADPLAPVAPAPYPPAEYDQPTYQQPPYQQPTYQQPTYQQPVYDEPVPPEPGPPRAGPGMGLWIGAAALLVAVLLLGSWLLLHGQGGTTATSGTPASLATTPPTPSPSPSTPPSSPSSPASSASSSSPSSSQSTALQGPAHEVGGQAQASAPRHAASAVDLDGRPVTYVPSNMVDGVADTAWRTPGNATNMLLTFHLDQPTTLTKVGLINGYAKVAYAGTRRYDWYHGNRRVLVVTWIFDDGTTIGQHLSDTMGMQTMAIHPVTTRTVKLRIDAVTPPGHGIAGRDDTAISEVSMVGRTG